MSLWHNFTKGIASILPPRAQLAHWTASTIVASEIGLLPQSAPALLDGHANAFSRCGEISGAETPRGTGQL
eukprot:scaffold493909_cov17-Prasinocladus_malaysianus.AAC.1